VSASKPPAPPKSTQHLGQPQPVRKKTIRLTQSPAGHIASQTKFYRVEGGEGARGVVVPPPPVPRPGGRKVIALILEWWNDLSGEDRARLLQLKDYAIAGEFCRTGGSKGDDQRNIARRITKLRSEGALGA
jgi:hypothetical protein